MPPRRLSRADQDRELLEATLTVNPWNASAYPRISAAWKAVHDLVHPKVTSTNVRHIRQRVNFLLNRYESRQSQGREQGAKNREVQRLLQKQLQPKQERPTQVTEEKPSDTESTEEKDREGTQLCLEALLEQAEDRRQREEDVVMENWMRKMLRKHTRRIKNTEKKETAASGTPLASQPPAPASPDYLCPVCREPFSLTEEPAALLHFAGHLDARPNRCLECRQAFMSRHELVQHLRVHVLKRAKYKRQQCDVCGEVFQGSMKAHVLKHGINNYSQKTCGVCGYSTHKTSILNKHLRTHSGEKLFLCDLCPKSYTSSVYLKEHKLSVHERERKFYCHMCTKSFYTNLRLRRHIKTHGGDRPFKCEQCGRGFTTSYNMRTHQRLHTGVKPYQCTLCQAAFVQKTSLDCHMKKHGIVTHRRPQSCEMGPDKLDQTGVITKLQSQQCLQQAEDTSSGRHSGKTSATKSSHEDSWLEDRLPSEDSEQRSQSETWTRQVPRTAVSQVTTSDLWTNKTVDRSERLETWSRMSADESSRDQGLAKESQPESSRGDVWRTPVEDPPRDALFWSRKYLGESSREEGWPRPPSTKVVGESPVGATWAGIGARRPPFREPPRDLSWPSLLPRRPHFGESTHGAESLPQDFSLSAEQGFARASQDAGSPLSRVTPACPPQVSESDRQTAGAYSMIHRY